MKIETLFNLLQASQNLLLAFEGVEKPAQLVSRLENLKRADVEGLLEDVDALRDALDVGLTDSIEMSGYVPGADDTTDGVLDSALNTFPELDGLEDEPQQDAPGNNSDDTQASKKENPVP